MTPPDHMTGRTILLGGAGFLGTAIARDLCDAGQDVLVLDLPDRLTAAAPLLEGIETRAFAFPALDGLADCLAGADALVHLAWTTTPASSMQDLARDAAQNIAPSVALFQEAGRAGVGRWPWFNRSAAARRADAAAAGSGGSRSTCSGKISMP